MIGLYVFMEYKYICDVKAYDLWLMAMKRTYRSVVGVINIVFTVAMILLLARFWNESNSLIQGLLIFGCVLFPVIQPLCTYLMCIKQLEDMPRDMVLTFNDKGVLVQTGEESQSLNWKNITNAIRRKNMIIVMSDDRHGYMLTNRVLGNDKESFYEFLCSKIKG
jgi:hypothetical protein